jgi:hypothetical protein
MRHVWVVAVIAGCYQPSSQEVPLPDARPYRPDAPILHDASSPHPDAPFYPDAYVPDARPDATAPSVCGDGTRAPGEVCFGAPLTIDVGELVYSARLRDVDGDGKLDLVYLSRTNIVVRSGNGAGGFAAPVVGPATDSWWLDVGDIDGDGIADIAAAGRQQLTVWFGTGGGDFGPPHTVGIIDGPVALAVADLDGYPGKEIVVATGEYVQSFTWFLDDFDRLSISGTASVALAIGDIDADGHMDCVVTQYDDAYQFNGTVDGLDTHGWVGGDGELAGVALANVDSDPKIDAVAAAPFADELAVYSKVQNAPDESTTHRYASELWPVTSGTPRFVAAADLDADGTSEVVAGMPDTMRVQLFHSGGTAGAAFQLAEPMTSQVFDGDANGDGIADLVVTLQDQIVVLPSAAP